MAIAIENEVCYNDVGLIKYNNGGYAMKNKKTVRLLLLLAVVLVMTLVATSCSKSNGSLGYDEDTFYSEEGNMGEVGSSLPSYSEKGEMADNSADKIEDSELAPKIIKTASVDAETRDFTGAVAQIESSVKALGGYIESCNITNRSYTYSGGVSATRNANYVLRIPADKLDEFLSEAGALLNVTASSSKAEDISGEYYDIQARISVLETERALVEKMLSEADDVDTMISLESRLYDIIYEIESYKTAIKVYDSKVSYSTVNLSIREVADLTDIDADPSFASRFQRAVFESWDNTVAYGEEFVIWLVYAMPGIIVVCVTLLVGAAIPVSLALILFLLIRGAVKRAKRRKRTS